MRKAILKVTETLKFQREVPVQIPDGMDEDELNEALDAAQRGAESVDDLVFDLRKFGIKQTEPYDDSLDSPFDGEVECEDYEFVADEDGDHHA